MKVPVKIPREWFMIGEPASHETRRGEYAVALNCTITNASEKTRPVRGIIPEALADSTAIAAEAPASEVRSGRYRASRRGTTMARTMAPAA